MAPAESTPQAPAINNGHVSKAEWLASEFKSDLKSLFRIKASQATVTKAPSASTSKAAWLASEFDSDVKSLFGMKKASQAQAVTSQAGTTRKPSQAASTTKAPSASTSKAVWATSEFDADIKTFVKSLFGFKSSRGYRHRTWTLTEREERLMQRKQHKKMVEMHNRKMAKFVHRGYVARPYASVRPRGAEAKTEMGERESRGKNHLRKDDKPGGGFPEEQKM